MSKLKIWSCPDCHRQFKHAHQWHSCYSGKIDDHFVNKPLEIRSLFDHLIHSLAGYLKFSISPVKTTIYLKNYSSFAAVYVRKKYLIVEFAADKVILDERIFKSTQYTKKLRIHYTRIHVKKDIDDLFIGWIRDAYELSG